MNGMRFTGDFLAIGDVDGRAVVAYRVFDEVRDTAVLTGVEFRDEANAVVRRQVELLAAATTGLPATTVDLNERKAQA